jgi:hypothetical protein
MADFNAVIWNNTIGEVSSTGILSDTCFAQGEVSSTGILSDTCSAQGEVSQGGLDRKYIMRAIFAGAFEVWVTTNPTSGPPSGHTVTDNTIIDIV